MVVKPIVAWYDLWIGFYWDRSRRRLYVLPLPCIGFYIDFGPREYPSEWPFTHRHYIGRRIMGVGRVVGLNNEPGVVLCQDSEGKFVNYRLPEFRDAEKPEA